MAAESTRILVIDDEPDLCWVLDQILSAHGYVVSTTTSGGRALELLAEQRYTVALVDAKLTDYDGLALAALIRRSSPHTAIILISGYFYAEDLIVTEGLRQNHFCSFLAKPFDPHAIQALVRQAIARATEEINVDTPYLTGR